MKKINAIGLLILVLLGTGAMAEAEDFSNAGDTLGQLILFEKHPAENKGNKVIWQMQISSPVTYPSKANADGSFSLSFFQSKVRVHFRKTARFVVNGVPVTMEKWKQKISMDEWIVVYGTFAGVVDTDGAVVINVWKLKTVDVR